MCLSSLQVSFKFTQANCAGVFAIYLPTQDFRGSKSIMQDLACSPPCCINGQHTGILEDALASAADCSNICTDTGTMMKLCVQCHRWKVKLSCFDSSLASAISHSSVGSGGSNTISSSFAGSQRYLGGVRAGTRAFSKHMLSHRRRIAPVLRRIEQAGRPGLHFTVGSRQVSFTWPTCLSLCMLLLWGTVPAFSAWALAYSTSSALHLMSLVISCLILHSWSQAWYCLDVLTLAFLHMFPNFLSFGIVIVHIEPEMWLAHYCQFGFFFLLS